jgi:hypothetical protein
MIRIANENNNKIKQSAQCCRYCGKTYIKRINLDKHIIICELLQKKKNTNDEENNEIPSNKKLYQIIIELTNKINNLEEKISEFNKYIVKKKKLLKPIDWLNENMNTIISFENLQNIFIIDENIINYLFNNSIFETLNLIISKIDNNLKHNTLPICSFIQKNNIIYIFENKEIGWIEMDIDKFSKLFNRIILKILIVFREWKKNNSELLKNDEKIQILCDKTTSKLMSIDFKNNNTYFKLKTILYNKLKIDILPNIEFEII